MKEEINFPLVPRFQSPFEASDMLLDLRRLKEANQCREGPSKEQLNNHGVGSTTCRGSLPETAQLQPET